MQRLIYTLRFTNNFLQVVFIFFKTIVSSANTTEHHNILTFHIPTTATAIHFLFCCIETKSKLTFSIRPLQYSVYLLESNFGLVIKFIERLGPNRRISI